MLNLILFEKVPFCNKQMATVSSDVLWELTKNHNSFQIRRDRKDFSSDPYNLANAQTKRFAGIAREDGIGVEHKKKDGSVVIRLKKRRKYGEKGKTGHETTIEVKRGGFAGRAKNTLASLVENRDASLVAAARQKMAKLHSTEVPKKTISRKK